MHRAPLPRPRAALSLGAWCVLLAGCGSPREEARAGVVTRLAPRPTAAWPATTTRMVERLAVEGPDLPRGWVLVGDGGGIHRDAGRRGSGPWIGALPQDGKQANLRIERPFDPRRFNRIALTLAPFGKVDLGLAFGRDGKLVLRTPIVRYDGDGTPKTVVIDVLETIEHPEPFDFLTIQQLRIQNYAAVIAVELLSTPIASLVPDPNGPPRPVTIASESRTAVGLVTGVPLEARAVPPEGGRLRFGFGRPLGLCQADRALEVEVEVEDARGARLLHERLPLRTGRRSILWQEANLDLPPGPPGEELAFRFTLRAEDGEPAGAVFASPRVERPGNTAPAVVLVTSDTHRADHLGLAGERGVGVRTPFLDELGARGVYFTNCYSSTNITNPSHGALLTGMSVRDTGVINNITALSDDARTLPELFQESGWLTFATLSARHLEHEQSGLGQGFDRMSQPARGDSAGEDSILRMRSISAGTEGLPVFLWLHLFDAHAPYEVPEDLRFLYYDPERDPYDPALPEPARDARPPWDPDVRDLDFVRSQYMAEVTYLDRQLARWLDQGRLRDALIALTGDHGESLGEHGMHYTHRGLYPETLAVPLILAGPGIPSGVRVEQAIDHLDVGRTLLDLAGLGHLDFPGSNLLRWVDAAPHSAPRFAISSHATEASIERDGWFLTLCLATTASSRKHEVHLYHLARDGECERDLVDDEFERARELRAELLAWLTAAPSQRLAQAQGDATAEEIANLAALGYAAEPTELGGAWYEEDPEDPWCRRFDG